MPIGPEYPKPEELIAIAADYGISLSGDEATSYVNNMTPAIQSLRRLEMEPEELLPVKYKRDAGWQPKPEDNPLNAWLWRCEIEGSGEGVLAGFDIGLKDVVSVAGLPLTNGTRILEHYVPNEDATIVTRILDAGGKIVGKTNTSDFSFSGTAHNCSHGSVLNPFDNTRDTGASSGGSGAAISSGDVPMAIGGDQGGSIRIPAAWSGCYGLKPSYGLVPYTGCGMIEMTMDHVGPMADSTENVARLLTAIAGTDPLDPRQRGIIPADFKFDYMEALGRGADGMKIGIVTEGFGLPEAGSVPASQAGVDDAVRNGAFAFEKLGATVEEVSLPEHVLGMDVYPAIMMEGATDYMMRGYGAGTNWQGYYQSSLYAALARGVKAHPGEIPPQVISVMLTGEYLHRRYYSRYYHMGQNLRRKVRAGYDRLFETYDILIMPTCPTVATEIAPRDATIEETLGASFSMLRNTGVQDVTGHPSFSIPCGMSDGMPVGMMMTGRALEDNTLLAASAAFESLGDWKQK